jgi:uncharacterized protein (TIGR02646 family)
MRKFQRVAEPSFLSARWEAWGLEWEQRRVDNPRTNFHWHQVDGEPVNQKMLPFLKGQTQDHCSFCDNFPVSPPSIDTIEHFRPKADYPREAYQWENLYFCCMHCQQKSIEFDEGLLRPDSVDYEFDRYFRWDYTLGTLEINEQASPEDKQRAEVTRRLYLLNVGHPSLRKRELRRRAQGPVDPLDDFAYRGYVDGPAQIQ